MMVTATIPTKQTDPLTWLKEQVERKRNDAYAESAYGSRERRLEFQAMVNAYDVVLHLIERSNDGGS